MLCCRHFLLMKLTGSILSGPLGLPELSKGAQKHCSKINPVLPTAKTCEILLRNGDRYWTSFHTSIYIDNNGHENGRISAQESRNFPLLTFEQYLVVQKDEPSRENWDWNCIRVFTALCILPQHYMLWNLTSSPSGLFWFIRFFCVISFFDPTTAGKFHSQCHRIFRVW